MIIMKNHEYKLIKRGVCRKCGCTENSACYVSGIGTCWWVDDTKTLCSHCFYGCCELSLEESVGEQNG
ncbi:hypothetical protein [Solobacterium moorei]|uniref:hypothetical protein n=1 Tax=Solobacterium moorei TaxID=102148 RepID=UPI001B7F93E8|nr:hypothetical protein [Solobacterium moorei]